MSDTLITVNGQMLTDPALRLTRSGYEVATFRLESTAQRFDRQSDRWVQGETAYYRVSCWRDLARNVAESLRKGSHVIVHGRLGQRAWEREVGGEFVRTLSLEIDARLVGPDLRTGAVSWSDAESKQRWEMIGAQQPAVGRPRDQPAGASV